MQELKNKIITIEDVLNIAEILNTRYQSLKQQDEESKKRKRIKRIWRPIL